MPAMSEGPHFIAMRGRYHKNDPYAPSCRVRKAHMRGPENAVVVAAIGELMYLGYRAEAMRLEFTIAPGSRVDIAVLDEAYVLMVECKAVKVTRANLAQAERYLAAGRERWPDRQVLVVLTAPDRDERIVEPEGIIIARIAA